MVRHLVFVCSVVPLFAENFFIEPKLVAILVVTPVGAILLSIFVGDEVSTL